MTAERASSARSMSDLACRALAAFIADCRPDFDAPGVTAALKAERDRYDPWQLAAAMLRRASDPANTTPRLQVFDHAPVGCRRHPGSPVRLDGLCGVCWSEAHGVEYEARTGVRSHPLRAAVAAVRGEVTHG